MDLVTIRFNLVVVLNQVLLMGEFRGLCDGYGGASENYGRSLIKLWVLDKEGNGVREEEVGLKSNNQVRSG